MGALADDTCTPVQNRMHLFLIECIVSALAKAEEVDKSPDDCPSAAKRDLSSEEWEATYV